MPLQKQALAKASSLLFNLSIRHLGPVWFCGVASGKAGEGLVEQGACGTCLSSTATMKMGIERALRVRQRSIAHVVALLYSPDSGFVV